MVQLYVLETPMKPCCSTPAIDCTVSSCVPLMIARGGRRPGRQLICLKGWGVGSLDQGQQSCLVVKCNRKATQAATSSVNA